MWYSLHAPVFRYWVKLRPGYFWISGQSLIKRNCHNSWTSDDIDIKLEPITKLDKRNKTTSKKSWRLRHIEKFWRHCHFSMYGQFGAICKPDSGCTVCKTYIFINSHKNWKQNWKISNTALTLLLWVNVLFWLKNADFLQKNSDISKIIEALISKVIFSETTYDCVQMPNFKFLAYL